ncbi:LPXTG cell wall anchor domain-containing protein [Clostridiales bacterium BAD-6]|uniref:LPXTG cell wall anchor domain-containing protein n=2 Tax=Sinanaerobacter chloroacetimidivorans TaxID=2818044 RepID=A0A8J8B3S2_9FIRM|nr:LPXTG cell wall anchor domain-containing protein [Sinanaerobacter chloroacetimidivorans]
MDKTAQKTATEYAVADNTNIEKGEDHMLGYDFLQASPEERLITILVLIGVLAVVGIAALVSKRRKKN